MSAHNTIFTFRALQTLHEPLQDTKNTIILIHSKDNFSRKRLQKHHRTHVSFRLQIKRLCFRLMYVINSNTERILLHIITIFKIHTVLLHVWPKNNHIIIYPLWVFFDEHTPNWISKFYWNCSQSSYINFNKIKCRIKKLFFWTPKVKG